MRIAAIRWCPLKKNIETYYDFYIERCNVSPVDDNYSYRYIHHIHFFITIAIKKFEYLTFLQIKFSMSKVIY